MNASLLSSFQAGIGVDVRAFAPELWICVSIVFLLLVRLVPRYDRIHLGWIALVMAAVACAASVLQWLRIDPIDPRVDPSFLARGPIDLFGGMLVFDDFAVYIKIFLYAFVTLVVLLTLLAGIPDREDSADFYCLLFGSTLGMSLMASANHLLMVFIGIEMASLPSYALAGYLKGRRQSSEAALKYVVYGGGASGVMLYGISLLAGRFGTGYLPDVMAGMDRSGALAEAGVALGVTFLLVGIGFKLAAFPFHFWCPDVFEGAAAEVGAFLSVASKGAALALVARIVLGLAVFPTVSDAVGAEAQAQGLAKRLQAAETQAKNQAGGAVALQELRSETAKAQARARAWGHATDYLVPILAIFAIITTTFGNLAAFAQTNLKRLLAYSTIAHAGFMLMGLATMTRAGAAAVLFYLAVYLFMNLGAFAVVAFMRNLTGHEDLSYYRGFVYRSPVLVIMLGVFLLSLLGLPPLGGFAAKFQIFQVLFDSAQEYERAGKPRLSWILYGLVLAGGLNTVISLFYYVKVLKVMVLERTLEEVESRPVAIKPAPVLQSAYATFLALVVLALGIVWNPLFASSEHGVGGFQTAQTTTGTPHKKGAD